MSIYNWIQKVFFEIYEEWHMKDPAYDRNGFHISGIDNALKAMHDGYYTYAEISPSYAVKGLYVYESGSREKQRAGQFIFENRG